MKLVNRIGIENLLVEGGFGRAGWKRKAQKGKLELEPAFVPPWRDKRGKGGDLFVDTRRLFGTFD